MLTRTKLIWQEADIAVTPSLYLPGGSIGLTLFDSGVHIVTDDC